MQQLAQQSRSAPATVDDGAGQGALAGQAQVPQSLQRTWQADGKPSGGPVITHPTRITRPRNLVTDTGPDEAAILAGIAAAITTLSSTLALDNTNGPASTAVREAADDAAAFARQHAADIASALAGIVVLGGCDLLTAGAGSRTLCPAAAGATSHAVSYTINAAMHGTFNWDGFGRAVLTGAAQWAAAGILGDIFAPPQTPPAAPALRLDSGRSPQTGHAPQDAGRPVGRGGRRLGCGRASDRPRQQRPRLLRGRRQRACPRP